MDESAGGVEGLGKQAVVTGQKVETSMRRGTEQVRFLGEEAGIRLPRAMAGLASEMPGVGAAINAAFGVTAILFAIEMVDNLTKKFGNWIYGVKESNTELQKWNEEMLKDQKSLQGLIETLANFGKDADTLARDKITALVGVMNEQTKSVAEAQQGMYGLTKVYGDAAANLPIYLQYQQQEIKAQEALTTATMQHELAIKQLQKTEADDAKKKADKDEENAIKSILAYTELLNGIQEKYNGEVKELGTTLKSMAADIKEAGPIEIATPKNVQAILDMRRAAQALSVTLRSDLVAKLEEAKNAKDAFVATMGTKDTPQLALFDAAIQKASLAVKNFGVVSIDTQLEQKKVAISLAEAELVQARARGENVKSIEQEIAALKKQEYGLKAAQAASEKAKSEIAQFASTMTSAANAMGGAIQQAMTGVVEHQKDIGKELEKSMFSMLASMAAQWGAYFIGIGTGEMLSGDPSGAAVLAEGVALEALAGVLGGLGGGGGSSSGASGGNGKNNYAYGSSVSDTGSQAGSGRSNVSVQAFADGGLVTQPTLALIGEAGPEAVVPLSGRGSAPGSGGGLGDTHFHFNINGMISDDNMGKVIKKMSRMVTRGQAHLQASESFKNTKRGA